MTAGAAIAAGLKLEELPSVDSFFEHVAKTLGGPLEGSPSITKYSFQLPSKDLLKLVWPLALKCFNSELSGAMMKPTVIVPQRWRPVVAARAVNTFIGQVATVLPPKDALTIVMETAIYASKLQPSVVEPA